VKLVIARIFKIMLSALLAIILIIINFSLKDFIALFTFSYISIWIHEFGHVIFGELSQFKIEKVTIGKGEELFKVNILGILLIVNLGDGGLTSVKNTPKNHIKFRYSMFAIGGTLMQIIFSVIVFLIFGFHYTFNSANTQCSLYFFEGNDKCSYISIVEQ
jgi:hypothetical protein